MAICKLDVSGLFIRGGASSADLEAGLAELQAKLARNHELSNFFRQPMKGFPQYQNKVWKWDFAPAGESNSTRKGWRLLAFVPNPQGPEPIIARAFICYDKDEEPKGNPAKNLANILKIFLKQTIEVEATPDPFRRQDLPDGRIVSLCCDCCGEPIFSTNRDEAQIQEASHVCRDG